MSRHTRHILMLTIAAGASLAIAQADDRFREVEAGFEDVSDQALSMRMQRVDMRSPIGFERVYEVLGSEGLYARRAGAVTAVFDRSLYVGNGTPLIPAGTVFYIGSLPVDLGKPGLLSPERLGGVSMVIGERVDVIADAMVVERPLVQRVDLRVKPGESISRPPIVSMTASIWTSESYRQRRIGELLRAAAWKAREIEAAGER